MPPHLIIMDKVVLLGMIFFKMKCVCKTQMIPPSDHKKEMKSNYLSFCEYLTNYSMSAEGGHLGWRSGSLDTILKIDHLKTIHAMFALNWLTGFREEDF